MRAAKSSSTHRPGLIAAWCVLGLILFVSFCIDFDNVTQGGAIDLRNRITGVRLLAHGIDPYFYKWHTGEPPEYCDPYNNPQLPVSKTTATPALLLLHLPFSALPYRLGEFLWFFAQWFLLLAGAIGWGRVLPAIGPRLLFALFVVGFTCTAAWRLHAERGQAYVLLFFLFAWWLRATLADEGKNRFLIGLLAGLLIAVRPPFLLLAPFLALHRRGQLAGAGVGLLLGLGLPMLFEPGCWSTYASAMHEQSLYYRADTTLHAPLRVPPRIEGTYTEILARYLPIPYADFSIHALLRKLGLAPFPELPPLLFGGAGFAFWLWWSRRQREEIVLVGLAAWLFLFDLLLPAYRNSYNDVLIINVVALGLLAAPRSPALWPCFLALPAGWAVYAYVWDQAWLINLPSLLFTVGCGLGLFLFNSAPNPRKVGKAC